MPSPISGSLTVGAWSYPWVRITLIVGGILILAATLLFLRRSRLGLLIRASAQDIEMARSLGVPAARVYSITFGLGTFLAAIAAGLLAPIRSVEPTMGLDVILDAFIVVIIGGLGSIVGALIASLLIGLTQSVSVIFMAPWHGQILSFALLIIVLLVKPEGIMGEL